VLKQGETVAGRYVLQSLIGEGAMGAVWRAEDQTLRRQIAIKFLFVRAARDPQAMVDQFLREARIAASVQHRNVIHTVDFGTVDQYQPFMVMELLSGESLGDRMAREPKLSAEQFIHLISLTLRGLSAVHDAGIVHRDLKPQNVFLQRDAEAVYPKILDFGISRSLEQRGDRPSALATQEGLIVGTPDYMSPEQARGEANIDRRSDIYSMGVILYEGLSGRLPFEANTVGELIVQIMTKEPPTLRQLDPSILRVLSDLIAQAMSKDREQRFADARALRRALMSAAESMLPQARRSAASGPPAPPAPPSAGRRPPPPPVVSARPGAGAGGSAAAGVGGAGTWGDFEGLRASALVDHSPPPVLSVPAPGAGIGPPQQQRLVAHVGDQAALSLPPPRGASPALLSLPPAPPPASAARGGRKSSAKAKSTEPDAAQALDPLYAGSNMAAPDIDYGRAQVAPPQRRPVAVGMPADRRRSAQRVAQPKVRYKARWGHWVLPIVALALGAYVFMEPPLQGTRPPPGALGATGGPGASGGGSAVSNALADPALQGLRHVAKARRANPGAAPPHLRDVLF